MFEKGERIEFRYPVKNSVMIECGYRWRCIDVNRVRDLVAFPLTPQEFLRRPFVRRSRWLITGVEVGTGRWRNFYVGASPEFEAPAVLRIGLYVPNENKPRKIVSRGFGDCVAERRKLVKLLCLLATENLGKTDLQIRVVADDLRFIG